MYVVLEVDRALTGTSRSVTGMRAEAVLEVSGLAVQRGGRHLVSGLSFRLDTGRSIAVVGHFGAGKTSLLNCVLGTVMPSVGSITVAGTEITELNARGLARLRAQTLGVVFQSGELLGELSPVENVALLALITGCPRDKAVERATKLLRTFGVPLEREAADDLSGGERQRVALARALVNKPAVVLADEPTGSLDVEIRDSGAEVLFDAPRQWGCGLLVVTHDPQIAARADRVLNLGSTARNAV